ncbi:MAG TPA: hypothetical protein VIK20_06255 [Bacteroidales bacterium]
MFQFDNRIVMTLDAGGTNFVFSAIRANQEMIKPICLASNSDIVNGTLKGNQQSARRAFAEMGEEAGDSIAHAVSLVDGLVVIGGGLTGASNFFMPSLMKELNGKIGKSNGDSFRRLEMKAYNLDNENEMDQFLQGRVTDINIPGTGRTVEYDSTKRIGVAISKLGASKAIALGAYAFAFQKLDS